MPRLVFVWDDRKASSNEKKHGVTFDEAMSVFSDDFALFDHDSDQPEAEDRFLLLGLSSRLRILVVCHAHRNNDAVIRIISARKATAKERKNYSERHTP